jgi:hypothetical protein
LVAAIAIVILIFFLYLQNQISLYSQILLVAMLNRGRTDLPANHERKNSAERIGPKAKFDGPILECILRRWGRIVRGITERDTLKPKKNDMAVMLW